ncbi:MAG: glucosyl-3-phosphoglycerate synthase [Actinomycetota bacterium]|nr:glucosyl-3-phosphoglycerate synthase [Actinomycetota bacterium]
MGEGRGGPAIASFDHSEFTAEQLAGAKGNRRVSVCIPARNEEATVGLVVEATMRDLVERVALVEEVVVVDDHSSDRTGVVAARAGARVVPANDSGRSGRPGPGKGQALRTAVSAARGDVLVFLDADVSDFGSHFVVGLLGPMLLGDGVALVKGCYRRPLNGSHGGGGRVTELLARPLLVRLFPELSQIAQPLAGEFAVRSSVFEGLSLAPGYGVDVALLIDLAQRFGVCSLAQVDLGERRHRNRPLSELAPQAMAVLDAILERAGVCLPEGAVPAPSPQTLVAVRVPTTFFTVPLDEELLAELKQTKAEIDLLQVQLKELVARLQESGATTQEIARALRNDDRPAG